MTASQRAFQRLNVVCVKGKGSWEKRLLHQQPGRDGAWPEQMLTLSIQHCLCARFGYALSTHTNPQLDL